MELIMTAKTITNKKTELTKNYIINLLAQLTIDYQNTQSEQKKLIEQFSPSEYEFTILEEIELLTTELRGYASQIKFRGYIENPQSVRQTLQQLRLFEMPIIAEFYFNNSSSYPQIKSYLRMLDYLRLLILEYLNLSQTN